jgi:hypothetical protein
MSCGVVQDGVVQSRKRRDYPDDESWEFALVVHCLHCGGFSWFKAAKREALDSLLAE